VKNRINPFTDNLFQVIGAGDIADHAAHAPVLALQVGADMIKQHDLLNALGFTARRAKPVNLTQSTRQAQTQETRTTRDENFQNLYLKCVS
jgi:hypothetical protein